MANDPLDNHFI